MPGVGPTYYIGEQRLWLTETSLRHDWPAVKTMKREWVKCECSSRRPIPTRKLFSATPEATQTPSPLLGLRFLSQVSTGDVNVESQWPCIPDQSLSNLTRLPPNTQAPTSKHPLSPTNSRYSLVLLPLTVFDWTSFNLHFEFAFALQL